VNIFDSVDLEVLAETAERLKRCEFAWPLRRFR